MTDVEQIELIQKCAASIWENAEKIAGNYKYQTGLDINIRIRYGDVPSISVNQTLVPELAVEKE